MKEYFDRHFGPKETFPTEAIEKPKEKSKVPRKSDKTKTSAAKNSPVSGKATSLGKGASQKACSDELKSNSRSQGVVKTVSQAKSSLKKSAGQGKSSSQIAKGDKKDAESTSNMKSGVSKSIAHIKKAKSPIKTKMEASSDAKSAKSMSEKCEPSKEKTNHSLFANIRKEAEASSSEVHQRSPIDSHSEKSVEMGTLDQPRERSQSASASTFKPRYGFGCKIQSAQSSDSFFSNSRAGLRTVVPRPLPILNVQFVVPHEFSEQF